MSLFEKERLSSRSKMNKIEISEVIEDIKYSSLNSEHSKNLVEKGYLKFIQPKNNFNGNMCYFIKPTKEVNEHMKKTGYGKPTIVGYSDITNAISFYTKWEGAVPMTTTPQIAGVLKPDELYNKLSKVTYEGDCQVDKAYSKLYNFEPNYALHSINFSGRTLEKMKSLSRDIWLAAGFMLNDKEMTQKANNGDFDMAFKDAKKMKLLQDNFKFNNNFYIPKSKPKKTMKP